MACPAAHRPVPDKSRTTPDARAHNGRAETIGWAYERPDGGRSFAFTGCDLHRNWQVESQRRLVVNGILWTAKLEVPEAGARSGVQSGRAREEPGRQAQARAKAGGAIAGGYSLSK